MARLRWQNREQNDNRLAEPFSQIFIDRPEAEWAFDLLQETARRLGLSNAYDERFALTLPHPSGKLGLHLNFGRWLVLGFTGPGQTTYRVELVLLANQVTWDERLEVYPFTRKEGQPEVRSYQLPIEIVRPLTSELQAAYETTLDFIAAKFHAWKRSPYWQHHNPEIIAALFDLEQRERLFAGELEETELVYERHYTPFYQDISEEEEVYEVGFPPEDLSMGSSDNSLNATGDEKPQNVALKTIVVQALTGIKPSFQEDLYKAMKNCNNRERILVCLYFMSDLPNDRHHLDEIEKNLRKIFPPSQRDEKSPDDYKDFQASMVRGSFSAENREVKEGRLSETNRLWELLSKGHWRNTPLGNQRALEILRKENLSVQIADVDLVKGFDDDLGSEDKAANEIRLNPAYPLSELAEKTGLDETELARWVRAIERKGQAILYGPPGTGKTYLAEKLADHLIGGGDGFKDLIQFHPAYAYEDFIQGIRPVSDGGRLSYPLVRGRFLEFCDQARTCQDRCVLIVDEINRANLARVFGELMYLLEYRERKVPLAGGGSFEIPANVRMIGTMNTADRSIALVDHALRRRFAFIALYPNYDVLRRYHRREQTGFPVEGLIDTLKQLNRRINDPHYEVGITFFLRPDLADQIEDIWRMEIEPYLEEYFFDQPRETINDFRWEAVKQKIGP